MAAASGLLLSCRAYVGLANTEFHCISSELDNGERRKLVGVFTPNSPGESSVFMMS